MSFFPIRKFQSLAPLYQQEAAAAEERNHFSHHLETKDSKPGPSRSSETRQRTYDPSHKLYNRDSWTSSSRDRDTSRSNRTKAQVDSHIDEEGHQVRLRNDLVASPTFDPETVRANESEAEVKEDPATEYKPVRWLEYKDRIDEGFLLGMKTVFRYSHLTEVQDTILSRMPIKRDMLVRSKTGTGKTLAFLIPAIQRHIDYIKENNLNIRQYPKTNAGVLVISPTRELAMQIASEARRLVFCTQPSGMKAQVLVGGDSKRLQIRRMDRERNDIIVATPGRLLDYLRSEPGVKDLLMNIKALVLDETDTLLDMGFRQEITEILSHLEPTEKDRVTMMLSATISPEVKSLAKKTARHDIEFVNTVKKDDLDVHQTVNQTYIVRDMSDHLKIILSLIITEQMKRPNGKVIIFFNTTKQVQLYTLMFRVLRRLYFNPHFQQFEIHSRKDQDTRSKVQLHFRGANVGSVLFTSDISYNFPGIEMLTILFSARGVDYPGVTKVIQVGAPRDRDTYVHRIGRTGRAGKHGDGTLILAPFERDFLKDLRDIPIKDHELPPSELEVGSKEKKVIKLALDIPPDGMLEETFSSLLGYCNFHKSSNLTI